MTTYNKKIYIIQSIIISFLLSFLSIKSFALENAPDNNMLCLKGLQALSGLENIKLNNTDSRKLKIKKVQKDLQKICTQYSDYSLETDQSQREVIANQLKNTADKLNNSLSHFINDPQEVNVDYYVENYGDLAEVVVALSLFNSQLMQVQSNNDTDTQVLNTISQSIRNTSLLTKKLLTSAPGGLAVNLKSKIADKL